MHAYTYSSTTSREPPRRRSRRKDHHTSPFRCHIYMHTYICIHYRADPLRSFMQTAPFSEHYFTGTSEAMKEQKNVTDPHTDVIYTYIHTCIHMHIYIYISICITDPFRSLLQTAPSPSKRTLHICI